MQWLYHAIRYFLVQWGYWALLVALFGENLGLPLPGETTLMFASFLAHKHTGLQLKWLIVTGTLAAMIGDNLGFLLGRKLGPTLIRWVKKIFRLDDEDVGAAKDQVRRHGAATIFWARYIFGLRTVAGPLAGMLGMEWKKFATFNALGAATWVTSMSLIGYAFANQFRSLLDFFEKASWIMGAGLLGLGYYLWHRQKKNYKEKIDGKKAA